MHQPVQQSVDPDIVYLHNIIIEGKYNEALTYIENHKLKHKMRFQRQKARALTGLKKFGDAVKVLQDLKKLVWQFNHKESDELNWLMYVCLVLDGRQCDANLLTCKFDNNSKGYLRGQIDKQLAVLIGGCDVVMELPFYLNSQKEKIPIQLIQGISKDSCPDEASIWDYLSFCIQNKSCRDEDYISTRNNFIHCLKYLKSMDTDLSDNSHLLLNTGFAFLVFLDKSSKELESFQKDTVLRLASFFDFSNYRMEDCNPDVDRIFDPEDNIPDSVNQYILVNKSRTHMVIAYLDRKEDVKQLLRNFLSGPNEHKEVLFSGHGSANGDWCFGDGALTFEDFLEAISSYYPSHIMANCCNSLVWGEKWEKHVREKFENPICCSVTLSAFSSLEPVDGGHFSNPMPYLHPGSEEVTSILDNSKQTLERWKESLPDKPKELSDLREQLERSRSASVTQEPPFPLGFDNFNEFENFAKVIFEDFKCDKFSTPTLFIQGSSINGFRWKKKEGYGRLFDGFSDYDIGILSEDLINFYNKTFDKIDDSHGPFDKETEWDFMKNLIEKAESLSKDHKVAFKIFQNESTAKQTLGCSLRVSYINGDISTSLEGTLFKNWELRLQEKTRGLELIKPFI